MEDGQTGVIRELYAELCQIVHPAAQSMSWLIRQSADTTLVTLMGGDDRSAITSLCKRHEQAIQDVLMLNFNLSVCILKVLNGLPLRTLATRAVDTIPMDQVPLWNKIRTEFVRPITPKDGFSSQLNL